MISLIGDAANYEAIEPRVPCDQLKSSYRRFMVTNIISPGVYQYKTTGATCGAGTAYLPEHIGFSGVRVAESLISCAICCRCLLILLYFSFWPLCCPFFFDLRLRITPLVSSTFSSSINYQRQQNFRFRNTSNCDQNNPIVSLESYSCCFHYSVRVYMISIISKLTFVTIVSTQSYFTTLCTFTGGTITYISQTFV